MRSVAGYVGQIDADDVAEVRHQIHSSSDSSVICASLFLGTNVSVGLVIHPDTDNEDRHALMVRYLHRVADQALALIAEIGRALPDVKEVPGE